MPLIRHTYHPLGYKRVYLPLYKVADTPFHIQRDNMYWSHGKTYTCTAMPSKKSVTANYRVSSLVLQNHEIFYINQENTFFSIRNHYQCLSQHFPAHLYTYVMGLQLI